MESEEMNSKKTGKEVNETVLKRQECGLREAIPKTNSLSKVKIMLPSLKTDMLSLALPLIET